MTGSIKYSGLLSMILLQIIMSSCSIEKHNTLVRKPQTVIIDMEVDKLGNIYKIDNFQNIILINENQKIKYSYCNPQLGNLSMLDVTNPHKLLLFYKDQQTLVFLDNTLTEISMIQLDAESFYSAAGQANDGNIWLFDSYLHKLIKINNSGKKIDESFSIEDSDLLQISSSKILERENYVLLTSENDYVFLFTNLGYFVKKIHLSGISKPVIVGEKIYYYDKDNYLYSSYDLKYGEITVEYDFSSTKPQIVLYENNKFYILNENNKFYLLKK